MRRVAEPATHPEGRYTYGDYRSWEDGERWELIDGEAWSMSAAPNPRHQVIVTSLAARLINHLGGPAQMSGCLVFASPFDVVVPDHPGQEVDQARTVVQPDVSVICDRAKITSYGCLGGPELTVEIISPHTAKRDLADKHAVYQRAGVLEYWVLDAGNRYVHLYRRGEDGRFRPPEVLTEGMRIISRVLPGFELDVGELFTLPI